MSRIGIIDYGMGNLRNVERAFRHMGAEAVLLRSPDFDMDNYDGFIFPGVGAFGKAMENITTQGWADALKKIIGGKPVLGICLGLQLMFESSEEVYMGKEYAGLGLFPGKVKRFPDMGLKVPHMGWSRVKVLDMHPLFEGVKDGSYFYFVHSFYAPLGDYTLAEAEYGIQFSAAIGNENLMATQFHPEKSGRAGSIVVKNFINITRV